MALLVAQIDVDLPSCTGTAQPGPGRGGGGVEQLQFRQGEGQAYLGVAIFREQEKTGLQGSVQDRGVHDQIAHGSGRPQPRQHLIVAAEHGVEALQARTMVNTQGTERLVALLSAETVTIDLGSQPGQVQGGSPGWRGQGHAALAVHEPFSGAGFGIDFVQDAVRLRGTVIGVRLRHQV